MHAPNSGFRFRPWVLTLGLGLGIAVQVQAASYFLSSSGGNDSNPGTEDQPWETLAKISATPLHPGDTVFFKRGDRFDGHFLLNGSGSEDAPITISAYGYGDHPVITGEVGEAGGGDYQEAILVENHDHLVFDGLEINNERTVTRWGTPSLLHYAFHRSIDTPIRLPLEIGEEGVDVSIHGSRSDLNYYCLVSTDLQNWNPAPIRGPDENGYHSLLLEAEGGTARFMRFAVSPK
jgi:hypothetical protein